MTPRSRRLCLFLALAAAASILAAALAVRAVNPENPLVLRALEPAPLRSDPDGPLDLNRATAEELEALPGIGPVLAESILARREEQGPFESPEDILAVPGIGEGTYEKILPYITY